jgi:hypothetical protein
MLAYTSCKRWYRSSSATIYIYVVVRIYYEVCTSAHTKAVLLCLYVYVVVRIYYEVCSIAHTVAVRLCIHVYF